MASPEDRLKDVIELCKQYACDTYYEYDQTIIRERFNTIKEVANGTIPASVD